MKRSIFIFLFITMLFPNIVSAAFVVSDIRIEGLQRVSAGTVFTTLSINAGDSVSDLDIAQSIRELFRTGYFDNIEIAREGDILVIVLVERPSISTISITGNKSIETENLTDGLKSAGLIEGEIFQQAILERVQLELERLYINQGRYGAKIETEVVPQPRNRIALNITIAEGEMAKIKHINVVGNTVFDDDELLSLFELRTTNFLSFYRNDDKYSREKLSGDLERLRSYYLDRGYVNFNIESTQVAITPEDNDIFITVNIIEGEKYTISDVALAGKFIIPEEQLEELILVKEGDIFSRKKVTVTAELLSGRLGNEGYTFANVNGIPNLDEETKTISLTFFVDPGRRAYVRRIEFKGNTKTADEVLRREMRQMEASWASTKKIEQSKVRLERLGFFKEVNVETPAVPGANDQLDVVYTVEEQASGSISASVGYSQSGGLILGGNLSQRNFLGTGNRVTINLNRSSYRTNYGFSFLNPYYTVDGISRGFNFYYRSTDYEENDIGSYLTDVFGGAVTFGYPISETERFSFSFGYENISVTEGTLAPQEVSSFLAAEGDSFNEFAIGAVWSQSTLNSGLLPTRGASQKLSLKVAVPGSDQPYYKVNYEGQYFKPITNYWTLRLSGELGYGDGFGNATSLPFYRHFYAGGFGSVRGFEDNTLGPRSTPHPADPDKDGDPFGGNLLIEGTAELIFPTPFIKDNRAIRTAFFVDAGNVFDTDRGDGLDIGELRYSVGFGLTWITGFGPLTFSIAKPLNSDSADEVEVFQFSLGQVF